MNNITKLNYFNWFYYISISLLNSDVKRGVFVIYLLGAGLTNTEIGFIQTSLFLAIMLGEIPSGIIADKYGRKSALLLSFILMITYGVGFFIFTDFIPFLIMFIIHGLSFSLKSGADQALLYDHLKKIGKQHSFIKINSRARAISALTVAGSMALGGMIKDIASWNMLFSIYILSKIMGVIVCSFLFEVKSDNKHEHNDESNQEDNNEKFTLKKFFLSKKGLSLLPLFVGFSLYEAVLTPLYNYGQALLNNAGYSLSLIGFSYAAIELGNSALYLLSGKVSKLIRFTTLVIVTFFMLSVSLFFLPVSGKYMLMFFTITFCLPSFVDMVYLDYVNEHYPSEIRASCISVNGFISSMFIGAAYFIYGFLIERFTITNSVMYSSFLVLIALPISLYGLSRLNSAGDHHHIQELDH